MTICGSLSTDILEPHPILTRDQLHPTRTQAPYRSGERRRQTRAEGGLKRYPAAAVRRPDGDDLSYKSPQA